ncbi:hypothetical protein AB1Y20_012575 [Prymnesium parvum]|uniref:Macrocin O-methyltransferase n=1 Tax=Prymnesium parvum TaxID=97485 RepID=A0AB34IL81_PRYPA
MDHEKESEAEQAKVELNDEELKEMIEATAIGNRCEPVSSDMCFKVLHQMNSLIAGMALNAPKQITLARVFSAYTGVAVQDEAWALEKVGNRLQASLMQHNKRLSKARHAKSAQLRDRARRAAEGLMVPFPFAGTIKRVVQHAVEELSSTMRNAADGLKKRRMAADLKVIVEDQTSLRMLVAAAMSVPDTTPRFEELPLAEASVPRDQPFHAARIAALATAYANDAERSSSPPSPIDAASQRAAISTFDRVRRFVRNSSVVDDYRLLLTAQLAHRSISVEGDFVETGVAAGGASILMLAVLDDAGQPARLKRHFACDSFMGLPAGSRQDMSRYNNCSMKERAESSAKGCGMRNGNKYDQAEQLKRFEGKFKVAREQFERNVHMSPVPYQRMVVVEGWFNETLPPRGLERISFLRLDGDLYESTIVGLNTLYPLLAVGGAIYIDDYGSFGGCRVAVDEYRQKHSIITPMTKIWTKRIARAFGNISKHLTSPSTHTSYVFEAVWWIKE